MTNYKPIYESSYALIIGINNYHNNHFSPLGNAEKDAKSIANVLGDPPYSFDVTVLIGKEATRQTILDKLSDLENTKTNDRVVFYFAGHGYTYKDREGMLTGYLAAYDTKPKRRHTAVRVDEITELIRHAEAKHISFIFDSCYSSTALGLIAPRHIAMPAEDYLKSRVYQALTAGEKIVDDTRSMTEYLVKLLSEAKVDADTGLLTMSTMAEFVRERMLIERRTQRPLLGYLEGSEGGEFVFLVETGLRLPSDLLAALHSNLSSVRWGAVSELAHIAQTNNELSSIAENWLSKLASEDPERRIRVAAQNYFDIQNPREAIPSSTIEQISTASTSRENRAQPNNQNDIARSKSQPRKQKLTATMVLNVWLRHAIPRLPFERHTTVTAENWIKSMLIGFALIVLFYGLVFLFCAAVVMLPNLFG